MISYLIVDKNVKELETLIFSAQGGDAVAVFTDASAAQRYIDDAKWSDKYTVASLQPIEFLDWILTCHKNGVRYMITDPDRALQQSGHLMESMDIEGQLKKAGHQIQQLSVQDAAEVS